MPQLTLSRYAIEKLIIDPEISSKKTYDNKYQRPVWPGGASGVTIGLGFDIGHQTPASLLSDLSGLMPVENIMALSIACGVTGIRAKALCNKLQHIVFLWPQACELFYRKSLPNYAKQAVSVYDELHELHPYEQTAIVGIVYNRGAKAKDEPGSDRRKEMRELIQAIRDDNDTLMARLIKNMKRLWDKKKMGGLHKRYDLTAEFIALPDKPLPESDLVRIDV